MKRRSFLTAVGATGAAATLAACGGDTKPSGDGGGAELTPETTGELTMFYWDKNQTPTVDANIKRFNEKYPKIKVTTSIAAYKDYWTKLRTQAEGDQLPDVFWMNGPNIQLYASNGMLATLDDVKDVDWGNYPKALVDLYTVESKHYGIPKDYDTIAVFANKKLFADANVELPTDGWTWEQHNDAARKIAATGVYGLVSTIGSADGQGTYYNTIAQAGGYVIKDGKSGFGQPEAIRGLKFWSDLVAEGTIPSLQVMSDTTPTDLFANGKAGMFWAGSWMVAAFAEQMASLDDVIVLPLPQDKQKGTIIHGLSYVASAKSKNMAAAKALVTAMTTKESAEAEAANGTAIPAFNGTQQAWVDGKPGMQLDVFTKGAEEYSVAYPVSKNTAAWNDLETQLLPDAFAGKTPMEETAKKLAEQMDALLAKE
ncbi:MAG: sugar ABC transporter substrate-binding protein [Arachnia sp.]